MRVRVLFFGVLRQALGAEQRTYELPGESCSVAVLLDHLQLTTGAGMQNLWPQLAVAINHEYARGTDVVRSGDEVALLPPVSGGCKSAAHTSRVLLTREVLQAERNVAALKASTDGAVVVFDGIVRDNTRGRRTQYLVYEAYEPMALAQMQALIVEAGQRFAVRDALLHHRLGRLAVGETSVLIAVASAHRAAAFDACRWLIDTLKQRVPIWKQEHFVDGVVWAAGEPFPTSVLPAIKPGEKKS